MSEQTRTGHDMKLYRGAANTALASLTLVALVRDVNTSMDTSMAEFRRRGTRFVRRKVTTSDLSLEVTLEYDEDHADYNFFRDAALTGEEVTLAALSDEDDAAEAEGPFGNFVISNFSRNEPLDGDVNCSFTATLSSLHTNVDPPWHGYTAPE